MSAQHIDRVARQNAIVDKIKSSGLKEKYVTAKELLSLLDEQHFAGDNINARIRLLQRELNSMVLDGILSVVNENKKPFQYRLAPLDNAEKFDPIMWAHYIKQMQDALASVIPGNRLTAIIEKLNFPEAGIELSENQLRIIPDQIRLMPAQFKLSVFSVVLEALAKNKPIEVIYRNKNGEQRHRILHVQAGYQRGPVFYVHAASDNDDVVKMYALHRFVSARLLDGNSRKISSFNLDTAILDGTADFGQGKMIELVLLTRGYATDLLSECPLNLNQVMINETEYTEFDSRLTATIAQTGHLFRWLISFGDKIKLLEPRDIARSILQQSESVAALYRNPE